MQLQMCVYFVFIGISIDFKMKLRGIGEVLDSFSGTSGELRVSGRF